MSSSSGSEGARETMRPAVMATKHVVASGHYLSAQAGFQILEAGGNAIDAGVATGLATCVLESEFVGFGGVAPTLIYLAQEQEVVTISGVGPWPQAATCEYFHNHHGGKVPDGLLHTVVPAAPDIWISALERHGTMSFGEVAASAIAFARDGFAMYPMMRECLANKRDNFSQWPTTAEIFLPGGKLPDVGDIFVQRDLARSLQYLVDEEKAHAGKGRAAGLQAARDAFYRGDIAAALIKHQKEEGGLMREADLANFRAEFEAPCRTRFHGADIFSTGPWCQGPMILEALNFLEGIDLAALGHNSAGYIHAVAEALKLAAADREFYYGDPKFVDVPLDTLLSKPYAATRRELIRPDEAWAEMPPAGTVEGRVPPPWMPDPSSGAAIYSDAAQPLETSYLCAIDREGNIFSATPSDPVISGPVTPGTGITASMWGSRAHTNPDHPASVGPGRRPRMSASPMLAKSDGKFFQPFGSPGSEVVGQAQLQGFLNVNVFGMSPQAAVEAPRFASYSWPGSALPHSYHPGRINLEGRIDKETGDALADLGHDVEWWPDFKWLAGSVCTVRVDAETGVRHAGADPRRTAYAVGW